MLFQSFVPSPVRGYATAWLSPWKDKMFPKKTLQISSGNPRGFTAGYSNVSAGEGRKNKLQELIFPSPACAEHSQHKMSLRSWIWTALHQSGLILREPLETGLERRAWRRKMVTGRGHGHREGMRAQRRDMGIEKVRSCDAAVKQSCEKGGTQSPRPSLGSVPGCRVSGMCSVISGAQHWVCRGGTAQANACHEQDRHSLCLGRSRGSASPLWCSAEQAKPNIPSP